jgi:hypothetical protein
VAFIALRFAVPWLFENGVRLYRPRGLQASPLYFLPYFLVQLATGMSFDQLCSEWRSLSAVRKVMCVIGLAAGAILFVYCGVQLGWNRFWLGAAYER